MMTDFASSQSVAYVYVSDRERGVSFYRDTIGMAHQSADAFGDAFTFGNGTMRLTALPDFKPGEHPVIGWDVDDIDAAVAALRARGIAMTVYEGMGQDALGVWRAPDGRAALAWFADPDGNCLMLSQHA
jgi:predicted enzyme related to lactoylglutathione lyase